MGKISSYGRYYSCRHKKNNRSKSIIQTIKRKVCTSIINDIVDNVIEGRTSSLIVRDICDEVNRQRLHATFNENAKILEDQITSTTENCNEVGHDLVNIELEKNSSELEEQTSASISYNVSSDNVSDDYNFERCTIPDYDEINEHNLDIELEINDSELIGYRIVDIQYLLEKSMFLQSNHNAKCTGGRLLFKKETRLGLISTFTYCCNICCKEYSFSTEEEGKKSSINKAAVWGTISTGSCYTHLEELLSVMDIPAISRNAFFDEQRELSKHWQESLYDVMESAGVEERRLAIENKQVDEDGIPYITVYLDGGWSKRSYGHSYNAASGVAVIIGEATTKVLFVGVRNKYCSICARAQNRNEEARNHTCFKNWNGASTSMESDIIVEGFNNSVVMHGIRYKKIIADGDSSVLSKIRQNVSYGREVVKLECTNHAVKNYGKSLYKIKNDTKTIPVEIRKLLSKDRIEKLIKMAMRAVYANAHGDVDSLKEDLRSTIFHVFHNHKICKTYMCNKQNEDENDETQLLYSSGAHHHVFGAINTLITKADILIEKKTNNRAELFMSLLARFNMGKRLNLVQRDGFQMRAFLTGLRYNQKQAWHYESWKKITNRSPGTYFKSYMKRQMAIQNKRIQIPAKKLKFPNQQEEKPESNTDYGTNISEVELSEPKINFEVDKLIERMKVSKEQQLKIEEETRGQFNNNRYITERMHRLTASNFGAVIKRKDKTSCDSLVKKILGHKTISTAAINYGKLKESVALSKFSEQLNVPVRQCGIFIDLCHCFLGASPDGIINDKEIVEIKCTKKVAESGISIEDAVRRKEIPYLEITSNSVQLKKNHDYYYQVQGQLSITKADVCHFVVYSGDKNPLFIEKIYRDDMLWTSMSEKLNKFYKNCLAPEIILNRIGRNLKCRDPPYILEAQKEKRN